jgi:hypothetical protein
MTTRSRRYDDAVVAVRAVVNRHDPEGLIEMGAPEDEYDAEVRDLVRLVVGAEPPSAESVLTVWQKWFGDSENLSSETVSALAADLVRLQNQGVRNVPDSGVARPTGDEDVR